MNPCRTQEGNIYKPLVPHQSMYLEELKHQLGVNAAPQRNKALSLSGAILLDLAQFRKCTKRGVTPVVLSRGA